MITADAGRLRGHPGSYEHLLGQWFDGRGEVRHNQPRRNRQPRSDGQRQETRPDLQGIKAICPQEIR